MNPLKRWRHHTQAIADMHAGGKASVPVPSSRAMRRAEQRYDRLQAKRAQAEQRRKDTPDADNR